MVVLFMLIIRQGASPINYSWFASFHLFPFRFSSFEDELEKLFRAKDSLFHWLDLIQLFISVVSVCLEPKVYEKFEFSRSNFPLVSRQKFKFNDINSKLQQHEERSGEIKFAF